MTIYSIDDEGNIIVVFDSRWRYPELLGYSPDDPEYTALQKLWEERTGKKIPGEDELTKDEPKGGAQMVRRIYGTGGKLIGSLRKSGSTARGRNSPGGIGL